MKNSKWDIPHRGYNFNKDLAFGKQGERLVQNFLDSLDQTAFEIKTDRYRNGRMCVEVEQNPMRKVDENGEQVWVKSGLMITKANWWVYVYTLNNEHGAFVTVSVKRLKKYIRKNRKRLVLMDFAKRSDNPSRGYLIEPLEVMDLLISPEYDE